ncbi:hypothetical protein SAPIO_CDS9133 [Scedosporium apiospermum]|uniref:Cyanovirin-N domain-containing protein n=1 Tax=Pseudallescheria apiosperma TaxID=563466 RepID=A0A084FYE9_PSEDA|nr:uncharacterized protein SAPIO_CDS9133 [Scedosporium apiospermum]KEZ40111.1 hypothetical protein SAPIO_CDS9133 [Scedosporium apiospermum]
MSFHQSAEDITLDGSTLRARLRNVDGEWVDAELNLDEVLGNNNGFFEWGGGGFSGSSENISFSIEGDDSVPVLRATLKNADGEDVHADVNLAERIHNNNGAFYFE